MVKTVNKQRLKIVLNRLKTVEKILKPLKLPKIVKRNTSLISSNMASRTGTIIAGPLKVNLNTNSSPLRKEKGKNSSPSSAV